MSVANTRNNQQNVQPEFAAMMSFGESLGIEVPTRYTATIHGAVNAMMAADSAITPGILGMSHSTIWVSRFVAGLLMVTRMDGLDAPLRQRLEIELGVGVILLIIAWQGILTKRVIDRAYLALGALIMIANSLMTEVE